MKEISMPISEKYILSIREAAVYFGLGEKKVRRLAEDHTDSFGLWNGNRYMIIRSKFEEYLLSCLTKEEENGEKTNIRRKGSI